MSQPRATAAMSRADLERALALYRELHCLMREAMRLPVSDIRRWSLSLRYHEIKNDLAMLFHRRSIS